MFAIPILQYLAVASYEKFYCPKNHNAEESFHDFMDSFENCEPTRVNTRQHSANYNDTHDTNFTILNITISLP